MFVQCTKKAVEHSQVTSDRSVLEFILRDELVEHLEKLHLLYESQHGFRRGRSCLSNLLVFLEQQNNKSC